MKVQVHTKLPLDETPTCRQQYHSPTLTLQEVIKKWKRKHDENLEKAKQRMKIEVEKSKKRLDILYKEGQYVKTINQSKSNKLDPSWKGPFQIIQVSANNNLIIQARNNNSQINIDNTMPYVTDDAHDLDTPDLSHTD